MRERFHIAILSDVHYAGATEKSVGDDYETRDLQPPLLRLALQLYRRHIWLRHPLRQNSQLYRFLARVGDVDRVVANGDYACNVAAVGVMTPPWKVRRNASGNCAPGLAKKF